MTNDTSGSGLTKKKNANNTEKWSPRIVELEREKWQDYRLEFRYTSNNYYDVGIDHTGDGFNVIFNKRPYDTPFYKEPDDTDKLFQLWWNDVKAWGIIENKRLVAVIETAVEEWSNRLIVTEIWIDDAYRRQGIATFLMDVAMKRAREEKCRAMILETQSCNEGAIAFYLDYGFSLIGFDACAYENNDLERKEVRMNFGIYLE